MDFRFTITTMARDVEPLAGDEICLKLTNLELTIPPEAMALMRDGETMTWTTGPFHVAMTMLPQEARNRSGN